MIRILSLLLLTATAALPQAALDKTFIFTGTTATVGAETYSWLVWQPSDPLFVSTHSLAVYRKSGPATSTSGYVRVSVVEPSADTRLISSLLPVAQKLGQDLTELDELLTDVLGDAMPAGTISTAEKISALIAAAHGKAEAMQRLILLGRQHPAMALCAGIAVADPVSSSGVVTYELRDYDRAADKDIAVIGRVTVDPAAVLMLPAPGQPFEVEDASAKGNLNISLRWATPDTLRDLSPLHYGYDVYRVPRAAAIGHGWDATPPATTSALIAEPQTVKVNRLAVLPQKLLDSIAATDPADTTTIFINDDNDRFRDGAPFPDGQRFFYFVVARDLLGRGGVPSAGREAQVKDRMPPNPPRNVRVRNLVTYVSPNRDQRFHIEWEAPVLPPGESISGWMVYRWRTPEELGRKAGDLHTVTGRPYRNLIAILPAGQMSFTDNGSTVPPPWAVNDWGVPTAPADNGKTFYYTVRAVDGSVSQNFSGNSAPVWGVLRDRDGPAGVDGGVNVKCVLPAVTFTSFTQVPLAGLTNDQGHYLFTCASSNLSPLGLDWAEFRIDLGNNNWQTLGRAGFTTAGMQRVAILRKTLRFVFPGVDYRFACRVCTKAGVISDWVNSTSTPSPQEDKYILALWNAALNCVTMPGLDCGWKHESVDPDTGDITDLGGTFTPGADAKEYKIYRRVNDSRQTLIASGKVVTTPVVWTDNNPVTGNAKVCYFLQLFDEHGNGGPLVPQGECVEYGSPTHLPTPMLEPIEATPDFLTRMKLRWFCNTAGVERFEVWVARKSGTPPGTTNSGLSSDVAGTHPNMLTEVDGADGLDFYVFDTGLARHLNTDGSPEFSVSLPVSVTDVYTVMIRAVGPGSFGTRMAGKFSNIESFQYALRKIGLGLQVPWPDRPLPPKTDFHPGVQAVFLNLTVLTPWKGNAVRIGEYEDFNQGSGHQTPDNNNPNQVVISIFPGLKDIENYLYRNDEVALAEPKEDIPGLILPVAMYRMQVPTANYPTVPGDLVQVTPLMEQIAQYEVPLAGQTYVTDPFVVLLSASETGLPRTIAVSDQDILLMDRQPVLKGARYKYLVVRFSPTKEIERVIATNEVDVP